MRAWVIESFGEPAGFVPAELPAPKPGPGEVRIKVAATSVNPVDYKIRSGAAQALCPPMPARLHGDVSGTIDAVGQGVERFKEGDKVFGCVGGAGDVQGALAEQVIADADLIAHAPQSIALEDAAALPLVTLTAWEGWDKAGHKTGDKLGELTGQRVLVFGGTGGVGHIALQLAKHRGAHVCATARSNDKADQARALGADQTIDYKQQTPEQYVADLTGGTGFDIAFDTVGGANLPNALSAAKLNGQVVCIQGRSEIDGGLLHMRGLSLHLVFMLIPLIHGIDRARHGRILTEAAALVDRGKLRPLIDAQRFTFEQIADAHTYAESGRQVGKVVVVHG